MRKPILVTIILILVLGMVPAATPTGACEPCEPHTPGYWKNHLEAWPTTPGADELERLNSPVKGDKYITLSASFIAARLNLFGGRCYECSDEVGGAFAAAYYWLDKYRNQRPVPAKSSAWQEIEWAHRLLDDFNNGRLACE